MIGQLSIETAPKYSFPRSPKFPWLLLKLSLRTLGISQESQQNTADDLAVPVLNGGEPTILKPIQLKPIKDGTQIAAADASSVNVGETASGVVVAVRGAVVYKQGRLYRYIRIGPFLFHVTEQNKHEVYKILKGDCDVSLNEEPILQDVTMAPDVSCLQPRMANLLERWLQADLCSTLHDGLILWDGSLVAKASDSSSSLVRDLLKTAQRNGNVVLALSKATRLRLWGQQLADALIDHKPPCLLPLDERLTSSDLSCYLGRVYVAKLDNRNVFRLDVDVEVPLDRAVQAVRRLIGNELMAQGYPESLRLAHILCTFTASEVIAMQRYLTSRYNVKIVTRPDVRKALFGPFGKGPDG